MLIVQRKPGERIVIDGGIEITIAEVSGRGVRLAIVAPRGVAVVRGEVFDAIARANADAASPPSAPAAANVETQHEETAECRSKEPVLEHSKSSPPGSSTSRKG